MKATCKGCKTIYNFDDSKIPEEGLSYKCPRCGKAVVFKKISSTVQESTSEFTSDESGTNPIVNGTYSGALGGIGCAIPSVLMTLLGIGFMSLGMEISGFTAASALLMSFLRMLSLGVLVGISLAFIGAKTEMDVWSVKGGLIGALIGTIIGVISGIFISTFIGGIFGFLAILGSIVGWIIKTTLVTVAVIIIRKYTFFSYHEGSLSSELSGVQKAAISTLFFLMIFTIGMEAKGLYLTKSGFREAMKEVSSEGLIVKDLVESLNSKGDLVITGAVENTTEDDKSGWFMIAELLDETGDVIRKARVINGVQSYNLKDIEAMKKRGQQIKPPDFLRHESHVIEPGGSVEFEVVFIEPPEGYKEYKITLKNLDFNNMQELLSESLKDLKDMKK